MKQNDLSTADHIWCVIPVYNNKDTVEKVALECRQRLNNVIVVDDGSTDAELRELFSGTDIIVLRHEKNRGKGKAILTALDFVHKKDGRFIITIDADGQHYPEDIEKFIPFLTDDETFILVGCREFMGKNIPGKSRFGRKFANLWLRIETGVSIGDCQSGFRAYPVQYLHKMKFTGSHYDYEAEVLTRSVWAGLSLKTVDINVWYPEAKQRITHFKLFLDNLRISLMHTKLVFQRLTQFSPKKLVHQSETGFEWKILIHPVKLLKGLLKENATPSGLAVSAAVGVFLGTLPLIAVHTVVIVYVSVRLHLNKIMAVSIQNLCIPPFIPFLCIELGHYIRYGKWLTRISMDIAVFQITDRLFEWLLGSLIIAPIGAVLAGVFVYFITKVLRKEIVADASIAG